MLDSPMWTKPAYAVLAMLRTAVGSQSARMTDPWADTDPYLVTANPYHLRTDLHPNFMPTLPTTRAAVATLVAAGRVAR